MRPSVQQGEPEVSARREDLTIPIPGEDTLSGGMLTLEQSPAALGLATLAGDLFFLVDHDLRYTYFNPFFALTMRHVYGTDAVLGEKAYESIPDDGRRRTVLGHLRRALAGARVVEEIRICLDDAVPRRYDLTYAPIKSGAAPAGGVTVFGVRNPIPATTR